MKVKEAKRIFYDRMATPIKNPWSPGAIFEVKMLGWAKSWFWLKGNRKEFPPKTKLGRNTKFQGIFRYIAQFGGKSVNYEWMLDYNRPENGKLIRKVRDYVRAKKYLDREIIIGRFCLGGKQIAWFQLIRTDEFVVDVR